ncbi:ATP-binding cassette domain-containing protein [Paraburkholderia nemoris]|uniref:hypothetical protein n=1 Tax=Paraburkholderia nemoris TaxID=2793076 RepID=UPI0038BDB7D9
MLHRLSDEFSAIIKTMREASVPMLSVEKISKTFHAGTVYERVALTRMSPELALGDFAIIAGDFATKMEAGAVSIDDTELRPVGRTLTCSATVRGRSDRRD